MLSKPNVKEILPKVGNRYQSVLAISKRARQIESETLEKRKAAKEALKAAGKELNAKDTDFSEYTFDAVDRAAKEIVDGKIYIKIDGKYAVTPQSEMEREIKEAQMAALKDDKE